MENVLNIAVLQHAVVHRRKLTLAHKVGTQLQNMAKRLQYTHFSCGKPRGGVERHEDSRRVVGGEAMLFLGFVLCT
jgi:hypothetical protein